MKKTRIRTLFLGRPKGDSFPGDENEEWPIYQGSFSHENLAARYREELKGYAEGGGIHGPDAGADAWGSWERRLRRCRTRTVF